MSLTFFFNLTKYLEYNIDSNWTEAGKDSNTKRAHTQSPNFITGGTIINLTISKQIIQILVKTDLSSFLFREII